MRRIRLLVEQTGAEGPVPAGTELVVDDAEARTLLGAIGLAEDLGEHVEIPGDPSRGDAGEGGGNPVQTDNPLPAPEAPAADGARPFAALAEGIDAPESGAPTSNPAPDGDGPRGDAAAPGEAASTSASPARPARTGKAKAGP